ncbi:uncharacterized protein LOC108212189 [Daucus carota subsp. sativus]|uniref:uncharacterized protein LOC108212189 n=1 Tax=Daucus carota subsp. sativus TaxID=79200 RepID=UPI0030838147
MKHPMFQKDLWYAAVSAGDAEAIRSFRIYSSRLTGRTILHNESMDGNKEHVQLILREFAGLLVKVDSNKDTALHLAAFYGHAQVVELLIDAARNLGSAADDPHNPITGFEAFVRHSNNSMNTALHVAVSKGNLAIAKLLVEADPDDAHIQNCNGDSPVNLAARLRSPDMVILICNSCTHPSLDGPDGTTALHLHAAIMMLPPQLNIVVLVLKNKHSTLLELSLIKLIRMVEILLCTWQHEKIIQLRLSG